MTGVLSLQPDLPCGIQLASSLLYCKCHRSNKYSAYSQLTKIERPVSSTLPLWTISISGEDGPAFTTSGISTLLRRSQSGRRNPQTCMSSNSTPLFDAEMIVFCSSRSFSLWFLPLMHLTTPWQVLGDLKTNF